MIARISKKICLLLVLLLLVVFVGAVTTGEAYAEEENCASLSVIRNDTFNKCNYSAFWPTQILEPGRDVILLKEISLIVDGEKYWTNGAAVTEHYYVFSLFHGDEATNYLVILDKNFNKIRTVPVTGTWHMHTFWNKIGTDYIRIDGSRSDNPPDKCFDIAALAKGAVTSTCSLGLITPPNTSKLSDPRGLGLIYQGEIESGNYIYTAAWDGGYQTWKKIDDKSTTCKNKTDSTCAYKFASERMHYIRNSNAIIISDKRDGKTVKVLYMPWNSYYNGEIEGISMAANGDLIITIGRGKSDPENRRVSFYRIPKAVHDPTYVPDYLAEWYNNNQALMAKENMKVPESFTVQKVGAPIIATDPSDSSFDEDELDELEELGEPIAAPDEPNCKAKTLSQADFDTCVTGAYKELKGYYKENRYSNIPDVFGKYSKAEVNEAIKQFKTTAALTAILSNIVTTKIYDTTLESIGYDKLITIFGNMLISGGKPSQRVAKYFNRLDDSKAKDILLKVSDGSAIATLILEGKTDQAKLQQIVASLSDVELFTLIGKLVSADADSALSTVLEYANGDTLIKAIEKFAILGNNKTLEKMLAVAKAKPSIIENVKNAADNMTNPIVRGVVLGIINTLEGKGGTITEIGEPPIATDTDQNPAEMYREGFDELSESFDGIIEAAKGDGLVVEGNGIIAASDDLADDIGPAVVSYDGVTYITSPADLCAVVAADPSGIATYIGNSISEITELMQYCTPEQAKAIIEGLDAQTIDTMINTVNDNNIEKIEPVVEGIKESLEGGKGAETKEKFGDILEALGLNRSDTHIKKVLTKVTDTIDKEDLIEIIDDEVNDEKSNKKLKEILNDTDKSSKSPKATIESDPKNDWQKDGLIVNDDDDDEGDDDEGDSKNDSGKKKQGNNDPDTPNTSKCDPNKEDCTYDGGLSQSVVTDSSICSLSAERKKEVPQAVLNAAGCEDLGDADLQNSFATVINAIIGILGIVAVGGIIYGGVQYMLAQGDPVKLKNAKTIIMYCAIGLAIVILSAAIVNWIIGLNS